MAAKKKKARTKTEKKDESIRLRLTPAEKEAFTRAAKLDGRDLSGWLRHIARQAAGMSASS